MSLAYFYTKLSDEDKHILSRALLNPPFVLLVQKELENTRANMANVAEGATLAETGMNYKIAKLEFEFWQQLDTIIKRNMKDVSPQ